MTDDCESMSDPLTDLLREYRRSLRRAGVIRGAALFGVALVGGIAAASLADFGFRPGSFALRVVMSCIAVAPAALVGLRLLMPAIKDPISDIELARLIEEREPRWRGRLAAATAFRGQDSTAGSCELQNRLVAEVTREIGAEPPSRIIDRVRLRRAVVVASLVGVAALTFAAARPAVARSGLLRLALPFADVEWPRAVRLVLTDESGEPLGERIQVGRGQTLRFRIRNTNGDVPDDLNLEVVTAEGQHRREAVPTTEDALESNDRRGLVGVGSLFADRGPFRFRAVGGDDRDMSFVVADVVPQPVLDAVIVTVTPPAYLKADAKTFDSGVATGLVGATASISATASKPLAAAQFFVGDNDAVAVDVHEDGQWLTASFVLEQPGLSAIRFQLQDRSGLVNDDAGRRELRIVGDAVPTATIVTPADDVTATSDAELPVVVEAIDDLGLTSVRIPFAREGLRYLADQSVEMTAPGTAVVPLFSGPDRPLKGSYPLLWSLSTLELRPGDRLEFCAEATDAFDLGPPHVGRSSPRSIRIVSAAEKREELLDRQADLLDDLVKVHADEERVLETVRTLRAEAERAEDISPTERDLLSRSELEQQRIASRLTDAEEGLLQHAAHALSELETNQLDDPALSGRLQRIVAELHVLRDSFLPAAEKSLTEARKSQERSANRAALAATEDDLGMVLQSVQSLLDELDAWRSRRDLADEAGELLAQQRELREETAKIAAQTLGTASGQLSEQQNLTLDRLRLRQNGLAERLTRFDDALRQFASSDGTTNPDESGNNDAAVPDQSVLTEASELLQNAAMPAAARAAVDSIRSNNLGEAGLLQRQLVVQLQALAELLSKSVRSRADLDALKDAASNLAHLADEQEQLIEPIREALQNGNGLDDESRNHIAEDQARLREQAAEAATSLRSATVSEAADSASDAAKAMTAGLDRLRRQDDQAALHELERARDRLRDAASDANRQAARAERRAAEELVASSADAISELSGRQGRLNDQVRQLAEQKGQAGSFNRSQLLAMRKLSADQEAIAVDAERLAPTFEGALVMSFALESAVTHMRQVQSSLNAKQVDPAVQRDGETAKARLDDIVSAFNATASAHADSRTGPAAANSSADGANELIPRLAELQLLKSLQQDLHRRTQEFNEIHEKDPLTAEQEELLKRLSVEQKAVLSMFQSLLEAPAPSNSEAAE